MIKVLIIFFVVLVLGRIAFISLVTEKKPEPEWLVLGLAEDRVSRVRDIQQVLKDSGFYQGTVDGQLGQATRQAIRKFQRKNRIKSTGNIDTTTIEAVNKWKEVRAQLDKDLRNKPGGMASSPAVTQEPFVWAEDKVGKTKQIQTALTKAGYFKGKIDGKMGPRSRKALKAFQKANGLSADGVAGVKTLKQLEKYLVQ